VSHTIVVVMVCYDAGVVRLTVLLICTVHWPCGATSDSHCWYTQNRRSSSSIYLSTSQPLADCIYIKHPLRLFVITLAIWTDLIILSLLRSEINCGRNCDINNHFASNLLEPNSTTRTPATNTSYEHHQRTPPTDKKCHIPTSWHVEMLGCGNFVVELLWACPLVVFVAGVRVLEFGSYRNTLRNSSHRR